MRRGKGSRRTSGTPVRPRTAKKRYRTTPLRGLATHAPYFHDGSAATLNDVVEHYDATLHLSLSAAQKQDLVEFLKSAVAQQTACDDAVVAAAARRLRTLPGFE